MLGEAGVALGRHVEQHVRLDLAEHGRHRARVPDVRLGELGPVRTGPAAGDPARQTDQPPGPVARNLAHDHRAHAPRSAGDEDGLATEPFVHVLAGQPEAAVLDLQEPGVLAVGVGTGRQERLGEYPQPLQRGRVQVL